MVLTVARTAISRAAARTIVRAAAPVARVPARLMSGHNAPSFNPETFTMGPPTAVLSFILGVPTVVALVLWNTQMGRFQN